MKRRIGWVVTVAMLATAAVAGCGQNTEKPGQQSSRTGDAARGADAPARSARPADGGLPEGHPPVSTPPSAGQPSEADAGAVTGITWTVPSGWKDQGARPMRVATYAIPAAGDAEGAECGVFYFGSGQGGDPDANISRWAGQFEGTPTPARSERTVAGIPVIIVQIGGTYLAPGGPMMESQGRKENYRLLGAIVQGPRGAVFFKLTGPSDTVSASESAFDSLIESITPQ